MMMMMMGMMGSVSARGELKEAPQWKMMTAIL